MIPEERPIVAAIHPKLIEELKERKRIIEFETDRKAKGGITCFSEMAALELWALRKSGEQLMKEIFNLKNPKVSKFNVEGIDTEFVPYWIFKKLYIFSSALSRRKDNHPIKIEVAKLKGLNKNEIKYIWP